MKKNTATRTMQLFRLYDENHILCDAPIKYKQAYYTALQFLTANENFSFGYDEFFADMKNLFSITENNNMTIMKALSFLTKTDNKKQAGLFGIFKKPIYERKYIYCLIIEAAYILYLADRFDFTDVISKMKAYYKFPKKVKAWFEVYFSMLFSKDTKSLLEYAQNVKIKYLSSTIKNVTEHLIKVINYESLPVFNVSVIATMSAGKSTFVNALLGNEIFPEANEACTAKITSIYDNDFFHRIAGIGLCNEKIQTVSNNLQNRDLIEWNSGKKFDRIILEGNLDNISNGKKIVAVHDTPGTNFSGNESHKKVTIDFLENTELELMLCVLNVEYLATTDETAVLGQLKQILKKQTKLPIVFIVNKIDVFDTETESLVNAIEKVKNNVLKHDFQNAVIIPTSAKAARLFKMALIRQHSQFTENEMDTFRKMFRKFSKGAIAAPIGIQTADNFSVTYSSDEKIEIDGTVYNLCDIEKALYNTGFFNIERLIDNKIINVNGEKR